MFDKGMIAMSDPLAFQSCLPISLGQYGCWKESHTTLIPSGPQKSHVLIPTMRTNIPLPYDSRFSRRSRISRNNTSNPVSNVDENWDKWVGNTDTTRAGDPSSDEADSIVKDAANVVVREDPDTSETSAPAIEEASVPSTESKTKPADSQTDLEDKSGNEITDANDFVKISPISSAKKKWDEWVGNTDETHARDSSSDEADSTVKDATNTANVVVREDPDTSEASAPAVEEASVPSTESQARTADSQADLEDKSGNEITDANDFVKNTVHNSIETASIKTVEGSANTITETDADDNTGTVKDASQDADASDDKETDTSVTSETDANDTVSVPSTESQSKPADSQADLDDKSENEITDANVFMKSTVHNSIETDSIKTVEGSANTITETDADDNTGTVKDVYQDSDTSDNKETDTSVTADTDANDTVVNETRNTVKTDSSKPAENHADVDSSNSLKDSAIESQFAVTTAASQSIKTALDKSSSNVNVILDGGDDGGGDDHGGRGRGENGGDDEGNDGEGEREELARMLRLSDAESQKATLEDLRSLHKATRVPLLGALALRWPALRNRLAANRRFPLQMGVEIAVGLITKTLAELQGRGEKFWKEFDFYLSDIALEVFGDAILVWLLSPVAIIGGARPSLLQRLPKHFGQVGAYSTSMRIGGFFFKAIQFGIAGFLSSIAGHGLTSWLVAKRDAQRRKSGDMDSSDSVELAPVLPTSLAWGGFLMTSSNVRYQLVNGFEQRVLDPLFGGNAALLTMLTFALRFGNCYVGGLHWLPWAKMWDIQ